MKHKHHRSKELEKNAARKLFACESSSTEEAVATVESFFSKNKEHKIHQLEANTVAVENLEKNKIRKHKSKQQKKNINDKVTVEPEMKPTSTDSHEEQHISDVQRYLEKLYSSEIGQYLDGLIVQENANMLPFEVLVAATVGDMDRMRNYFLPDPVTGISLYDANGRCLDGGTPLHAVIRSKHIESIQLLVENGADLSLVDLMGNNAIMASIKAADAKMINLLWKYKGNVDVNHENMVGMTALHIATEKCWEGCTTLLLANHALPDAMDENGVTPLMIAASKGHLKIVSSLVKAGADVCMEDSDSNTSVSRAYHENYPAVVSFLLKSLSTGKRICLVREMMAYVMNPDREYAFLEDRFIPIIEECTRHSEYRNTFFSQNVIHNIMIRMEGKRRDIDSTVQIASLLFCILFRFGNEIDIQFVKQFLNCRGADIVFSMVQFFVNDCQRLEKKVLHVFFPMISLVEICEGRQWLCKHVLAVSEYFNFFERAQLKVYLARNERFKWCLETRYFKEINRVWIHFYNEVNTLQTEQRGQHMMELLAQEKRGKDKEEKKREKTKQKKEQKSRLAECNVASNLIESKSERKLIEEQPEIEDEVSACTNANAFAGISRENPCAVNSFPHRTSQIHASNWQNPHCNIADEKVKNDDWKTVHTKKYKDKDRQISDKQQVTHSVAHNSKRNTYADQTRKKNKDSKSKPLQWEACSVSATAPVIATTRWADITRGVINNATTPNSEENIKLYPKPTNEYNEMPKSGFEDREKQFIERDFPCLDKHVKQTDKKENPHTMIFHFHEDQQTDIDSCTQMDDLIEDIIDIENAEMGLHEMEACTDTDEIVKDKINVIKQANSHMSPYDNCVKYDTECINQTEACRCDPTNRSYEEINSLNEPQNNYTHGLINENERKEIPPPQDESCLYTERIKVVPRESPENVQNINKNTHEALNQSQHQASPVISITSDKNNLYISNTSSMKKTSETKKNTAVVSKADMCNSDDKEVGDRYAKIDEKPLSKRHPIISETTVEIIECLSEAETELLRNQTETFPHFEEQLQYFENEHFIDILVLQYKPSVIDELFNIPQEIPEWLENEDDIPYPDNTRATEFPYDDPINTEQDNEHTKFSIPPDEGSICLNNLEKQSSVTTSSNHLYGSVLPAANCEFGQQLQHHTCRLEETADSEDKMSYPADLDGVLYEEDNEDQSSSQDSDDEVYFPSFHKDTMLSSHYRAEDVSVCHRMQQIQLEQLQNYYERCNEQIIDNTSPDQQKFVYYAQSAGMDRKQIAQHIDGNVEIKHKNNHQQRTISHVLPEKSELALCKDGHHELENQNNCNHPSGFIHQVQGQDQYLNSTTSIPKYRKMTDANLNKSHSKPVQGIQQPPIPTWPNVPFGFQRPFNPPPSHPTNTSRIQSHQAAMSSIVKTKIQEILQSMFNAKEKSVRWQQGLEMLKSLTPEKLLVIGKIVIPRNECDRVYIAYHCTGATLLGYLSDGSEVAVKMVDSSFRPVNQDEQDKLLTVEGSLFVNRYRAFEESAGLFYIATDLCEYTLTDYLHILRDDKCIDENTAIKRLVFQLMQGMSALHEGYLIVHAELRPDNVLIDIEGNVKIAGYGLGRNIYRDGFTEYDVDDRCWLAPEVLLHRHTPSFQTDMWAVGMITYYIYKGGNNPFGRVPREIIHNICTQAYKMECISVEADNLLSILLSGNDTERPVISDALKHPLFWTDEKRLRFVRIVGSDIEWESRTGVMQVRKQCETSMAYIVTNAPCDAMLTTWMDCIQSVVMRDMTRFREYRGTIIELILFIYNCCIHMEYLSCAVQEIIDEPCHYFLNKFPTLFMTVYRAVKFSNRKDGCCYTPFF